MIQLVQNIITKFISLAEEIFEYIFEGVNFNILWSWLPQDIYEAASGLILILFAIALIKGIRTFLPF